MNERHGDERRVRSTTRRRLVRGGAAALGAAAVPAFAGAATAQTDTGTDVDDEDEEKTLTAAIPASAPTYGDDDYTGLFVQVGNRKGDIDPAGIDSCSFVATENIEQVWGYNAEMFERHEDTQGGETITLYALAENTELGPEKRYIVNDSQPCGDYVEVELEQLQIGTVSGPETAVGGEGGGGDDAGTTETTTPGFGVLAALGGVGAAAAGALAARGDDAEE